MTIIKHIKETLEQLKNCGKPTGKFHYVNIFDETDTVATLEEAFERKLDLSKYEKREIFEINTAEQMTILAGDKFKKILLEDVIAVEQFYHVCRDISKGLMFQKMLKNINTRISRNEDESKVNPLRYERIMLYLRYGVTPQKSFADIEQYKQAFLDYHSGKAIQLKFKLPMNS